MSSWAARRLNRHNESWATSALGGTSRSTEIWAYGLRNPHRLMWDVDPARPRTPTLLAFNIGLVTSETVVVIHKGANYGYPLREGAQSMSRTNGMCLLPEEDKFRFRSRTPWHAGRSSRRTRCCSIPTIETLGRRPSDLRKITLPQNSLDRHAFRILRGTLHQILNG